MLRRLTADRYAADEGDQIQIVTESQRNDGVNDARFEYDNAVLPREQIDGRPGCTFTVERGRRRFQAVVAFAATAGDDARYDLFEVDPNGGLSDLRQHVTSLDSAPLIGFAVEGVAAVAAAGRGVRSAPPPMRKKTTAAEPRRRSGKRATKKRPPRRKKTTPSARRKSARPSRKKSTARRSRSRKRR